MTGDEFTALAERERWPLFRLCYAILRSYDDAEDCVQVALTKAWIARDRAPAGEIDRRRWLNVIARNTCRDHARAARIRPVMVAEDRNAAAPRTVEDEAMARIELAETFARIDTLLSLERGALIATALGYRACELRIRNGAMKGRVWRARERLARERLRRAA